MNRFSREARSGTVGSSSLLMQQRRGRIGGGMARDGGDEGLDLFSRNRRGLPVVSASTGEESDGQNGPPKVGNISVGLAKQPRVGVDDLLSGADIGKHDYDWLLTPPGTPLSSSLEAIQNQHPSEAPRSNSSSRSISTTKASRFSVAQSDSNHSTKPARSSSLTRRSISSTYSSDFSNNNNKTSVLNTSTTSITSYRSSTPTRRTTVVSAAKQTTTPTSRPTLSRPSTPVKARPSPSSVGEKSRPLHGLGPSTPTARPHFPANLSSSTNSNPVLARPSSRPSTPTRRAPATSASVCTRPSTPTRQAPALSSAPVHARSSSVGRLPATNSRNNNPPSRPSSPSPKIRSPVQPHVLPEFPLDTPPNLRTRLPERPASAGRSRPGTTLTVRTNLNSEAPTTAKSIQRPSSPIVTRGRFPENISKAKLHSNGHEITTFETQQSLTVSDGIVKKIAKPATTMESTTGFGRTISKKSLDMALRHMDIRQGMVGIRGASLFPQSIRTASKGHPTSKSDPVYPTAPNGTNMEDNDCDISISESYNGAISENSDTITMFPDKEFLMKKATMPDVFESSRYDSILLKEDKKNMNWLHSIDDNSDQSPVFDHRFEPLPEPFAFP